VGGRGPCPEGFTAHHADATNFRRKAEPGGPPAASEAMTDLPLAGVTCYQMDIEAQWRPDTGVPRQITTYPAKRPINSSFKTQACPQACPK
jgi:hypothetical protein